jgi:multidrug efflux pump subunit AcrB
LPSKKDLIIFLTIFSTILGFIPFMIGEYREAFWFPLAAGTIGGLIVSFIALFFFLPLFLGIKLNPHCSLLTHKC